MPEWISAISIGSVIVTLTSLIAFWKLTEPLRTILGSLHQIIEDWNGVPERRDASGQLIAHGRPGVMARLETLRAQVQNSHDSNLRDDLDKAIKGNAETKQILTEHIVNAEKSDKAQEELAALVKEHLPMLARVHNDLTGQEPAA